ncbi:MAG: geranylgeranylglyceryl/heptaprenylglyceryl phosphate synthase [Candidatus Geothermarchaeales archaeon]
MKGKVESYLWDKIRERGAIHLSLLDPLNTPTESLAEILRDVEMAESAGIMVGGSTVGNVELLNEFVSTVKGGTDLPVILFPNNISGLTPAADAIWFMSLFNSRNPYYITGAQMLAASTVKKFNLEPIPLAYLIIGEGGAAGVIGDANAIPYNQPEIAASYALAAGFLGLRFVYLEAGSGVKTPVPPDFVSVVRKTAPDVLLIVGGGIRDGERAYQLAEAGADILVTGTLIEDSPLRLKKLSEIVDAIRRGASLRRG